MDLFKERLSKETDAENWDRWKKEFPGGIIEVPENKKLAFGFTLNIDANGHAVFSFIYENGSKFGDMNREKPDPVEFANKFCNMQPKGTFDERLFKVNNVKIVTDRKFLLLEPTVSTDRAEHRQIIAKKCTKLAVECETNAAEFSDVKTKDDYFGVRIFDYDKGTIEFFCRRGTIGRVDEELKNKCADVLGYTCKSNKKNMNLKNPMVGPLISYRKHMVPILNGKYIFCGQNVFCPPDSSVYKYFLDYDEKYKKLFDYSCTLPVPEFLKQKPASSSAASACKKTKKK